MIRRTPAPGWLLAGTIVVSAACGEVERNRAGGAGPASEAGAAVPDGRDDSLLDEIDALTALGYASDVETGDDGSSGVVFHDEKRSAPGYNLFTVPALSRAELVDGRGERVHGWSHPDEGPGAPGNLQWYRSLLTPEGDLLVVGAERTDWSEPSGLPRVADEARYLMRLNWDGDLLWKCKLHAHHDVEITPAGQILTLTFQRREIPEIHSEVPVRVDRLTLLDGDGQRLESRSLLKAIRRRPEAFPLGSKAPDKLGGDPWVDLLHANSCEWMRNADLAERDAIYALDNVLVCFRHQHRIAIFNWTRNEVVWSWGQGEIWGPHDAQVMENGEILLFDNGLGKGRSRALLLDPLSNEIVWQWEADPPESFYTASQGSVQQLVGGNFLLTESESGRVLEITRSGERVWEYLCPLTTGPGRRAGIARTFRYEPELVEALLTESR